MRKWSWLVDRTLPVWVSPKTSISSSVGFAHGLGVSRDGPSGFLSAARGPSGRVPDGGSTSEATPGPGICNGRRQGRRGHAMAYITGPHGRLAGWPPIAWESHALQSHHLRRAAVGLPGCRTRRAIPGMPLDLTWVREVRVNRSAVERRAATIPTRRTVKKEWQAAWLLRAVTLMDLTTLQGDDTPGRVRRLCAKARAARCGRTSSTRSASQDLEHHGGGGVRLPRDGRRPRCEALGARGIPVAAVSTGFPGRTQPVRRSASREIRASVEAGAEEIDIVITRAHVLDRRLAGALRRGAAFRAGLRRRAHQGRSSAPASSARCATWRARAWSR